MRAEALESRPVQGFPVVRMCDADDEFRPFLKGFPVKVDGPVFGHEIVYVGA